MNKEKSMTQAINLNDFKIIENPYPTYKIVRDGGPIYRNEGGLIAITRFSEVESALSDKRLSADRSQLMKRMAPVETAQKFDYLHQQYANWMLMFDGEKHKKWRDMLRKVFLQRLQVVRPQLQTIAEMLIYDMKHKKRTDLIADFAYPFPMHVIGEILGINPKDYPQLIQWSEGLEAFLGGSPSQNPIKSMMIAEKSIREMTDYFQRQLEMRRNAPTDDLLSLLLPYYKTDEEEWSTEILLAQIGALMFGGHETTRNLIANSLRALLLHPQQLEPYRNGKTFESKAIMELVRYDSSAQRVARVATEDFIFGEELIKKGEIVMPLLGSANRDPLKFSNPDELNLERDEGNNLGFGAGPHVCIGASLAVMEGQIALNTLFEEIPDIQMVEQTIKWKSNLLFRGMESLFISTQ